VVLHCKYRSAVLPESCMLDIVDRVLESYQFSGELDPERIALSRAKVIGYIDKLASAGQRDVHQLTVYALEYLRELNEGPDRRFTGC
jgi:hypothetical protein